jgi:hypothetical protein
MSKGQFGKKLCLDCGKPIWEVSTYCYRCSCKHRPSRSKESKEQFSKARLAENNPNWKGDQVTINSLHKWIKLRKVKVELCECCHLAKPRDLANISQKYLRDVNDFEWLCRKCHMHKDDRIKNLKQYAKSS